MIRKIYFITLFCILLGCNKEDTNRRKIVLAYADTEINTIFRTAGSIAPVILDWDGEPGTYSISSSTEILQRDHVVFDSLTGQLSWVRNLPLGTFDFTITTTSGEATSSVELILTNTFIKGFFGGSFVIADVNDEEEVIDFSGIPNEYGLRLKEDGTIYMQKYDDPTFEASGTWVTIEGGTVSITVATNLSGGDTTYMRGFIANTGTSPLFRGTYGASISSENEIIDPVGAFNFKWD